MIEHPAGVRPATSSRHAVHALSGYTSYFDWKRAVHDAVEEGRLSPVAAYTTMRAAEYGDTSTTGEQVRPGIEALMRHCRASDKTIRRHLDEAKDAGLIQVVRRGGAGVATLYRLVMPSPVTSDLSTSSPVTSDLRSPVTSDLRSPVTSDLRGATGPITGHNTGHQRPTTLPTLVSKEEEEPSSSSSLTPIDDFVVTDAMREWFAAQDFIAAVDIEERTERFIEHHLTEGSTTARPRKWLRLWQGWMTKADEYERREAGRGRTNGNGQVMSTRHRSSNPDDRQAILNSFDTAAVAGRA